MSSLPRSVPLRNHPSICLQSPYRSGLMRRPCLICQRRSLVRPFNYIRPLIPVAKSCSFPTLIGHLVNDPCTSRSDRLAKSLNICYPHKNGVMLAFKPNGSEPDPALVFLINATQAFARSRARLVKLMIFGLAPTRRICSPTLNSSGTSNIPSS